jgi:hypothetical protein
MFLGKDGFVWFIGVVEDNEDPLLLGRTKVRIFGYHPEYSSGKVPTEDLPWAVPIVPINLPDTYRRLPLGEWVFGFFLDANEGEEPAILGYIPAIPKGADNFGRYQIKDRSYSKVNQTKKQDFVLKTDDGSIIEVSNTGTTTITTKNFIVNADTVKITGKNRIDLN